MNSNTAHVSRKWWVGGALAVAGLVALLVLRPAARHPASPADDADPARQLDPVDSSQPPALVGDPPALETETRAPSQPAAVPHRAPPPPFDAPPPRRAAELIEQGVGHGSSWPPGADSQGRPFDPSPFDDAVRGLAREIAREAGPEARDQALLLLRGEGEGVGQIGAAVLAEQPSWVWDEALLREVAEHADPAVPLLALQALVDGGRSQSAEALRELLVARLGDTPDWSKLPLSSPLPGSALRALVELSRTLDTDGRDAIELLAAVHTLETADYGARMAALLALREHLAFTAFRDAVRDEHARTDPDSPDVWRLGLGRLAERLEGPVEFHAADPVLTVTDVQVLTAREYPTQYEDLALHLEGLLRQPASRFGTGVTKAIRQEIERARQFPLADAEAAALRRLEALAERIEESDVSALIPPPPAS